METLLQAWIWVTHFVRNKIFNDCRNRLSVSNKRFYRIERELACATTQVITQKETHITWLICGSWNVAEIVNNSIINKHPTLFIAVCFVTLVETKFRIFWPIHICAKIQTKFIILRRIMLQQIRTLFSLFVKTERWVFEWLDDWKHKKKSSFQ